MLAPDQSSPRRRRGGTGGFTLVEAVMCVVLVGVAAVAAMNTVRTSAKMQFRNGDLSIARLLADGLMNDIVSLPYQDPVYTTNFLGVDGAENAAVKSTFDDVDDFDGWTESPPQDKDGVAFTGFTGWKRSVTVEWVAAAGLTGTASSSETGVKRITVKISHNNVLVLTRVAIRTNVPFTNQ